MEGTEGTEGPRGLWTARKVARRLNVRLPRAYELIRSGRIPAVRIGRQVRVDPLVVEDFIRAGGTGETE